MGTRAWLQLMLLLLAAAPACYVDAAAVDPSPLSTYIVQMSRSEMPASFDHHLHWYDSTIRSVVEAGDADPAGRFIYSYDTVFHGFAARFSEAEVRQLEERHGVLAIFPETIYQLHTTRSPKFLGLQSGPFAGFGSSVDAGQDVIVGLVDSGVWPESASFKDHGMGPVPARWKGKCNGGVNFTRHNCNRKLIGVRMFYKGYQAQWGDIGLKSARDLDGHGSHTASTVAGSPVEGANLLGYAAGTARGMAPGARLAMYKACWDACVTSDVMSAMDRAVADGVDVLSISLGGLPIPYWKDHMAVAAFGAMAKGVFVACSAGNDGPQESSVTNSSPWITTVGAGTLDRNFPASVRLGDGRNLTGVSLYRGRRSLSTRGQYPLVHFGYGRKAYCLKGSLRPKDVAGKIVLCYQASSLPAEKGYVVEKAGGLGMILANLPGQGEEVLPDSHLLPAVNVGERAGKVIKKYIDGSSRPTATLSFAGTKLDARPAPMVASFSSRGPNSLTPEILKPDVVAPGVTILAAWSGNTGPTGLSVDRRMVPFNIISGTSMACPHVAGVAALLRARHPDWSPAAIRSALMTTAYVHDNTDQPMKYDDTGAATPYAHGAGHINPAKALDPGLVYDVGREDYINFLCTFKLKPKEIKLFTRSSNISCDPAVTTPGDLNYPSISAPLPATSSLTVHRMVTNVGDPVSTYHVRVSAFKGATVVVEPSTLHFTQKKQKIQYRVTFTAKSPKQPSPEFGELVWSDETTHTVRTPVVVTYPPPA